MIGRVLGEAGWRLLTMAAEIVRRRELRALDRREQGRTRGLGR